MAAEALTGTVLTFGSLPGLLPLPWGQTFAVFAGALASCLVVNNAVKVAMIKWRVPAAVAWRTPVVALLGLAWGDTASAAGGTAP